MSEGGIHTTPFAVGDKVLVLPDVSAGFSGRVGEVVRAVERKRGPSSTVARYDYAVRFGASVQLWFADDELARAK